LIFHLRAQPTLSPVGPARQRPCTVLHYTALHCTALHYMPRQAEALTPIGAHDVSHSCRRLQPGVFNLTQSIVAHCLQPMAVALCTFARVARGGLPPANVKCVQLSHTLKSIFC
jgi:hypothetical protein